ncbi:50S ribosomal protein L9 [Candidatus Kuenenbacteria bacterium RIFCSPLOWO2_12_FULL_42_13]|uniref:Large ribosomal subunit protein bL9 n=4 Tax=Candidatus Kueneniibacteriota TaxID=1752740 RepID=A0A0G1BWT8_9BACT|nr:MAG: 50S ribosomal protein L9 [Candidatus Kuenenbacteria bacterium GW2011_GWA2_42_15]OGG90601.1 MAG: 50S ribosomal protein L9 [Candidatus Kuenenbacteria bacterium RIFCSPLOWO2_02_FULL_42_16]OGG91991.1 MAG: 50S ribosomal protein L9 [Candidatus Kuenenbacteria bacterium RIFCSPLOWO2_12_FULL_42_13]OGG98607.1 MAG: 50S ribosomal protein L9 [Candidatus Kuenenbacteria bacterium RIFCSPHIGHO2_12_FULL_42_14]
MKIILLKNVEKLGKAGEIKNVADGFALNFLLPKKMAEAATEQKIKKARNQENKKILAREKNLAENDKLLARLNGLKLEIKAKASDSGKLFAGLSAEDIAKELKTQKNIDIAAKRIRLEKHIKEVGEHGVEIDVENQKRASIVVAVRGL